MTGTTAGATKARQAGKGGDRTGVPELALGSSELDWAGLPLVGPGSAGLGWAGLGWAGLGCPWLGWAGLRVGWAGLGWAGLGWAWAGAAGLERLGWTGLGCPWLLGWAGLGWAGLGWAGLGWAGLGWAGLGWAGLGWAGLGWAGLGWAGLGWAGLGWAGLRVGSTSLAIPLPTWYASPAMPIPTRQPPRTRERWMATPWLGDPRGASVGLGQRVRLPPCPSRPGNHRGPASAGWRRRGWATPAVRQSAWVSECVSRHAHPDPATIADPRALDRDAVAGRPPRCFSRLGSASASPAMPIPTRQPSRTRQPPRPRERWMATPWLGDPRGASVGLGQREGETALGVGPPAVQGEAARGELGLDPGSGELR